jgi:hypothetical protein
LIVIMLLSRGLSWVRLNCDRQPFVGLLAGLLLFPREQAAR